MAGFKLKLFKGTRPRLSSTKIPVGEAQVASNVRLGSSDIEPWFEKSVDQSVTLGRESQTIYRYKNAGVPIWFEWDDKVDVAAGPVRGDSLERTYYTGDKTGTGAPKMTSITMANSTSTPAIAFPKDWAYMGIPVPVSPLTVVVPDPPESKPASLRFADNFKSDELEIDNIDWTVHPGAGTINGAWRLNSGVAESIEFGIDAGDSFVVTEVINSNKVKLESFSEPGIFARTVHSDKTTLNDWHAMDRQSTTTQTADFIGWRVPVGAVVTIVDHRLIVGDVIVVSTVNTQSLLSASLTVDFFEQSWDTELTVDEGGTSFKRLSNARVSASAVSGDAQFEIAGSFYYAVDRLASLVSELEDRTYVYTYVSDLGEEGPPSPVSTPVSVLDGVEVLLTGLAPPPTIGYNIESIRIYRTSSTEAGTEFQFVKEVPVTEGTSDAVVNSLLSEVISSTTWDAPDPEMEGIIALPNGMLAGFKGKNLYLCEPYFPHAWPPEYDQAVDHDIIGLAAFGNSIAVLTKGWPYIFTGAHPRNMASRPIKINQACENKESIAVDGDRVYYASPDGLVELSVNGIKLVTDRFVEKSDWALFEPKTMQGSFHEGRYYGFHGFDPNAVEIVKSAEASGTIATAVESNIINGGRTIVLTLINDQWVPVGTAFDAQRQNIINGLVALTSQTLGWNNIVIPGIAITDVVRTSDMVVTITLPAFSGYSVSTDEVVQTTIPASALLVSNIAIPTGSTFTVTSELPESSVSIGGTLSGALSTAIVTGGNTVILTLTNDTWLPAGTEFDAVRTLIATGLFAFTNEKDGWNDSVPQEVPVASVVRTSDTIVTITLPAIASYSITSDESISAKVNVNAVVNALRHLTSLNSVPVLSPGSSPSLLFSGSAITATENEVRAGGKQLIITATNDTWVTAGATFDAQRQNIIDALDATTDQTAGWNAQMRDIALVVTNVVRTSSTVVTISLPANANYSIATSESIGATIPSTALVAAGAVVVSNTFGILAQAPVTATLGGDILTAVESEIVAGGNVLTLTLASDTWVAAGALFDAQRQNIINGLDSAQAEVAGWDAEVKANEVVGAVVRTSDTVVTVTLSAAASYAIINAETITATIPATALNISSAGVVAAPDAIINADVPASVVMSGTLDTTGELDIRFTGGATIILTVLDDVLIAAGAPFDAQRQNIIDGLNSNQAEAGGWNAIIRNAALQVTDVVRTSDTVITITVPVSAGYTITTDEIITATLPGTVLAQQVVSPVATPSATIVNDTPATVALSGTLNGQPENTVTSGGKTIVLTLSDDTLVAAGATFDAQRQNIINGLTSAQSEANGWNAQVRDGSLSVNNVVRTSDTVITINLPATPAYGIGAAETITATIPGTALVEQPMAVIASPSATVTDVATTAIVTGTAQNAAEVHIIAGGRTIILTLSNDTWVAAGSAFDAQRQAIINGLDSAQVEAAGWDAEVKAKEVVGAVVRTSDTIVTITLSAQAGYSVTANETITATIPAAAVVLHTSSIIATPDLTVLDDVPAAVALSGTLPGATESDIIAGGKTIILTVTEDTLVAVGATFDAQRQNIINGLTSAQSEANGWNAVVRDGVLGVANVVRTSDTVVTITLPAAPDYLVGANEVVTATLPGTALIEQTGSAVATPTATIANVVTTVAMAGTFDGALESEIVAGGKTITLVLQTDTWIAAGAAFDAQRQNIINGLDSAQAEPAGWDVEIKAKEVVGAVIRNSNTMVTITLSAAAAYAITADEVITATVPASAVVASAVPVVSNTKSILAEETAGVQVDMPDLSNQQIEFNQPSVTANIKVDNNKLYYKSNSVGGYGSSSGTWLTAGETSQVWVERTVDAGSLDTDTIGSGRVATASDRIVGITTTDIGGPEKTASVTLRFYDAASGGTLLDTTALSFTVEILP